MKICEILDESAGRMEIGYLFYFEKADVYSIELSDNLSQEDAPLMFAHFIETGVRTVPPDWSERWVRQRIVPEERQNLGMILRENKLEYYNAYKMLMLGEGRCSQDDCMVIQVKESRLPDWLVERRKRKLDFAFAISSTCVLSCFKNNVMKIFDAGIHIDSISELKQLPGGTGVMLNERKYLAAETLYLEGQDLPINKEEFVKTVKAYILDTADVCDRLNCSRQYVNYLVKDNQLDILKESGNNRLYAFPDVERLTE